MKRFKLISLLMLLSLILAACGTAAGDAGKSESGKEAVSANGSEKKEDAAESSENETEDSKSAIDEETLKAEGTYGGQIDSHSIELLINDKAEAFQITEITDVSWEDIKPGTKVKIEFTQNQAGQNVLKKFEVIQ